MDRPEYLDLWWRSQPGDIDGSQRWSYERWTAFGVAHVDGTIPSGDCDERWSAAAEAVAQRSARVNRAKSTVAEHMSTSD